MSVIVFLYNSVYIPVLTSGIFKSKSLSDFIIKVSELTKKTPGDFQIFIQTLFYYSIMYINNDPDIGYDDFKVIIRDYIEISFARHTQLINGKVNTLEFTTTTQIRLLSCIMSRLLCDYLSNIKANVNNDFFNTCNID